MTESEKQSAETYDFRRPNQLADDVEQLLTQWHHAIVKVARSRFKDNFNFELQWEAGQIRTVQLKDVVDSQPESTMVMQHQIGGVNVGWFVMPRRVILSVFDQILGNEFKELPEDRPLSGIEESLFASFSAELEQAFFASQPCDKPIECQPSGSPNYESITNVFPESEQIIEVGFKLLENFDCHSFTWLISQQALLRFVTHVTESLNASNDPPPELERLIHQIPMNVVVDLGQANLSWSALTELSVGDVIMLDQRVSEPLEARIAEHGLFRGWAGRHGNSQAFRVSELVEPKST